MKIFVLLPTRGFQITLSVELTDTVASVKEKIKDKLGIPVDEQDLTYKWDELENDIILADYDIEDQSTLELTFTSDTQDVAVG